MRPLRLAVSFAALLALGASAAGTAPAQDPPRGRGEGRALTESAEFAQSGLTLRFPEGWTVRPRRYTNADELWNAPGDGRLPARIMITTEPRLDRAEAVKRLGQIATEAHSPVTYIEVGGWPALQRRQWIDRPTPGQPRVGIGHDRILRITTAVAVGATIVRMEASLPPSRVDELAEEVETLARSATFTTRGDPERVREEILRLQRETPPAVSPDDRKGASTTPADAHGAASYWDGVEKPLADEAGAAVRALAGGAEIAVAVSNNGQNVVVATNSGFTRSGDGGVTFGARGFPTFPPTYFRVNGDPSLAVGQSGTFYYALIGFPTGTAAGATSNSTAITVSTDNGQNFAFRANAVLCQGGGVPGAPGPGLCFADQEHIAADRTNAAPGGDQVYSTWRNFDGADQDPALVCSQDSANNWTAPLNVGTGIKPRMGVGQDGFAYVVYLNGNNVEIRKYSSCANGLALQAGFPQVVATIAEVTCPVPGLDRCTGRNTLASYTVAVDDTNANHVYVAFATNTANNVNENVLVRDSTNGGASWPAARVVQVNGGGNGRRFMPWMCTQGGTAHVTWYDRRNATAGSNDLTDFFRGSARLDGGGNLVAGPEVQITKVADPHCASGWPCATDRISDSEGCSVQPQLAGACTGTQTTGNPRGVACDFSDCDTCNAGTCSVSGGGCATNADCPRAAACTCTLAQGCVINSGCPKYGDYNYSACAAGRIYSVWASATKPPDVPTPTPPNRIDSFMTVDLVCCVPRIQAPAAVALPSTCAGDTGTAPLNVCNTGFTNLSVTGITSSDAQFAVPDTYPVNIAAGACRAFQVRFTPTSRGPKSATLTVASNDPVSPSVTAAASGTGRGLVSITCPADIDAPNDPGLCSAIVNTGVPVVQAEGCPVGVAAVRSDGLPLPAPFPVGSTTVTWTATDGGGNAMSCPQAVVVNDVEPPVIAGLGAVPNVLWPPNHKMRPVTVNYTVTDNCTAPAGIVCDLRVTSNEPSDGTGDGHTSSDWQVLDAHHVLLRAERSGRGSGRIYTETVTCTDEYKNASSGATIVTVPHNP